ncbi:S-layer homology domain-containing protein [Proteocatella sphenisci]|uniref:S-layer homology domain-containing protein n=1 Tax=Proteocatella sphenisci TaxID=181070 RepID=UPI00048AC77F|nr:S-layer homology domain-containing protein [Proteocatella sphenisci]
MYKKRVLGLTLALMLTGTSSIYANGFNDVKDSNWAAASISRMSEKNYVGGFPDGTFKPASNISRAEFVAIVNKINGFTDQQDSQFKDLNSSHWAYGEIKAATKAGYIGGFPDGTFGPNLPVTREQAAAILNNIYKLENSAKSVTIKDLSKVSPWAADSVMRVVSNGIMGGYEDGTFGPKKPVTRAECIVILDRIVSGIQKEAGKETGKTDPAGTPSTGTPSTGTPSTGTSSSTGGGSSSGGGGSKLPSAQQVKESLNSVVEELKSSVQPKLTTNLQKQTAEAISSSLSKYIANNNYSIDSDVENAKSKISQMSTAEYNAFKNAITGNIPAKDLDNLNKYFDLKK